MLVLLPIAFALASATIYHYDAYSGSQLSDQQWDQYVEENITFWCSNVIDLPCDANAYRTLDGTCNNLQTPIKGALHTPFSRVLAAEFGPGYGIRPTKSGNPPREPRELRIAALAEGKVPHQLFTHLITHAFLFYFADTISNQDTVNMIQWTNCCSEEGINNPECAVMLLNDEDPVHRFTDIRCMNSTVPITYQNRGCPISEDTLPSRMNTATPFMDLDGLYGSGINHEQKARTYSDGLLKNEIVDGRIWPMAMPPLFMRAICIANQGPEETRCHDFPVVGLNGLLGGNIMSLWAWRLHNYVATELKNINPCWSDEQLFQTARDISIALFTQIFFYELMPALFGWGNLVKDGILLSQKNKFRDIYDETIVPQTFLETAFISRYMHNLQPGHTELFDTVGNFLGDIPEVNLTLRTGYLARGNNMDYITQGAFRQPAAGADNIVDPELSEIGYPMAQRAFDILAADLNKNRLFGFPSYVKYLDFCNDCSHTTFDDLAPYTTPERLEIMKNNYEHVEDIDLMVGTWLEVPKAGGHLPSTFYCIMSRQLLKHIQFDRYWYERPNRPHAFTKAQLLEIRKSTIARYLCNTGDKVTEIQKHAFFRISRKNPLTSCSNIPNINFNAWADSTC